MKMFLHLLQHLPKLFLECEMFQIKVVKEIKVHNLRSITFSENCSIYEMMSKNTEEPEGPQMTSQYGA